MAQILLASFAAILIGRAFFRPQLRKLGRWLDALVNAMLVSIGLFFTVQLLLYFLAR